ncbi:hypothetical protein AB0C10_36515 [Microbispora amethystogenes]|uniref:hypothetical protein n=1 Tax=Microbispora amethystogenes TaxID=1427754 RepID=UPI0033CD9D4D
MDSAVAVAAIGGVLGLISAAYTARSANRANQQKTEADERTALRQIEAGAYERAKQFYESTLVRMQGEIDRQAAQINALQRQVSRLTRQVRDAGLVPVTSSESEEEK